MFVPRHHWHHYVGKPVMVHTRTGVYRGHLQGLTGTHLHLYGTRLASTTATQDLHIHTLETSSQSKCELVYFPGAAVAIPLAAVAGVTALGLGAMGWW